MRVYQNIDDFPYRNAKSDFLGAIVSFAKSFRRAETKKALSRFWAGGKKKKGQARRKMI